MSSENDSSKFLGTEPDYIKYWRTRWKENKLGWQLDDANPNLVKFIDRLTSESSNSISKKIFVPLCGKTRDIGYLLGRGFQVFAVEGVKQAIQELDQENGFNLKFNEKETIYHTDDNRLQIYYGDFFKCLIEKWGPFDCIWDRASFGAIEDEFRPAYKEMVQRSVRASQSEYCKFRYLLETIKYDKIKFDGPGPPRSVDEKDMEQLSDDWANVEILNVGPVDDEKIRDHLGGEVETVIYLLTPK